MESWAYSSQLCWQSPQSSPEKSNRIKDYISPEGAREKQINERYSNPDSPPHLMLPLSSQKVYAILKGFIRISISDLLNY